ncbi:broad specificity phosphatase PhoE [Microcella putealis]|uniref:Broad specificity phosphatase PhoE n=1 Tax=Microcella putealis TaxID=337005 RepID=A0A4Q7LNA1_9MICO|nr:histidine phosphatase family protein [Microcella putealis]RZS55168.1 broad specificity phosphatase PhoE [Microcella putealis]TQM23570.1 broad specificity phosphatase PhoE [Microcella putealis]
MPADVIHLVRHGEVHNPQRILYGRLEGYGLSDLGHRMAEASARSLGGHPITALYSSPLQRTRESAAPWQEAFGLEPHIDERLIEPMNRFEGKRMDRATLMNPKHWPWMLNPSKPSWGEPFASIATRMLAAMTDAHARTEGGEVVMVSHQLPIWMAHRAVAGKRLAHDPRTRRCALSSITSFAWRDGAFTEIGYQDPGVELGETPIDLGAV